MTETEEQNNAEAYAEPEQAKPIDTPFTDTYELNGEELQPFTPARVVAAQSMGLRYPIIGDDGLEQFEQTGLYPCALSDTIIVLWLCSNKKMSEIRRARRKGQEAYEIAEAWAGERGITNMASEEFAAAYKIFGGIMGEIAAATSKPKLPKTDGKDNKIDPKP